METKYGFSFSLNDITTNVTRLTNQLWKLIPMRENEEDWIKQLNTVLLEIAGLNELFGSTPQLLQLISKLEGLRIIECDFLFYRKTVFEAISLLQDFLKNDL